jgi:hypothetical protein
MAKDAAVRAHEEWIGLVQPTGLVVSPTALVQAQAIVDKNVRAEQLALARLVGSSLYNDRKAGRDGVGRVEHFPSCVFRRSRTPVPGKPDTQGCSRG